METRRLGRTGHDSSVAILGAAAFWNATPEQAEQHFALALERGCNHLDIAPAYGVAEDVVGPLVPGVRHRLFVGAKTGRKNADGVRAQLDTTLTKLGLDQLDLYQLHGVTSLDDLETRTDAAAVLLEAREQGLTRFVGITGHDMTAPVAHLEALRRWDLDTVMFPVAPRLFADEQYAADATALLEHCAAHDVGVQAIKAVSWRPWEDRTPSATTWYEPHADPVKVARGIDFALGTPGVHAFATPGDLGALSLALDAAASHRPMSADERAAAIDESARDPLIFPLADKAVRI